MKRFFLIMISLVMFFSLVAFSAYSSSGEKIIFTITTGVTSTSESPYNRALEFLTNYLTENSNGRIQVEAIPGGVLGAERELTESIQLGTLDMAFISDMGMNIVVGNLGWAWLPYLITSYDEADEFYINGWMGEKITEMLAEKGIVRLAATENDFRQCGNTVRPIKSMSDFKGLKIRVPEISELVRFYELCGALPVAMSGAEVFTALQQGTIDGVDNSYLNLQTMQVLDRLPYISEINLMYACGSIVASESFWNSLSTDDQELFKKAATLAGSTYREFQRSHTSNLVNGLVQAGKISIQIIDEEMKDALKVIGFQIWDEFAGKYDSEVMKRIFDEMAP